MSKRTFVMIADVEAVARMTGGAERRIESRTPQWSHRMRTD